MAEIPPLWRGYAARQSELDSRTSVDATSWGIEAGMNFLLEGNRLSTDSADVDRVADSAARRNRYGRALLAKKIIVRSEVHDDAGYIEAMSSLALLKQQLPPDRLGLLTELAEGTDPSELAARHRITTGALRTRVCRAREAARHIAL